MIYWQTKTGHILTTVQSLASLKLAQEKSSNGCMSRLVRFSGKIPFAAVAWRDDPRGPWRPLEELAGELEPGPRQLVKEMAVKFYEAHAILNNAIGEATTLLAHLKNMKDVIPTEPQIPGSFLNNLDAFKSFLKPSIDYSRSLFGKCTQLEQAAGGIKHV